LIDRVCDLFELSGEDGTILRMHCAAAV
jgi:hypothetical protein